MKAVLGPWFWVNKQINTHHKMLNPYRKKKKKFLCHICCKNVPLWQSHPKCSWRWQFIKADILTIRPTTPINWEISAAPLLSLPAQLWSLIPSHMSFPRSTSAFSPSPSYIRRVSGGLNIDLSTIPPLSHSTGAFLSHFHLLLCAYVTFIQCLLLPSPPRRGPACRHSTKHLWSVRNLHLRPPTSLKKVRSQWVVWDKERSVKSMWLL